ncbi:hypothetical protein EI94DRAFT_1700675 [Lactarius quietus]|nr:hypothetical protein EI94DRAFT_1700675 [Lactarius quietus]
MADDQDCDSATWSHAEDVILVRTLAEEKAKGNCNGNSPNKAAWGNEYVLSNYPTPGQYAFRAGQKSTFDLDRSPSPPSPSLDSHDYSSSELFMKDDELATPTFGKRSKSGCTSSSRRQKRRRVSVGEGLCEMADALCRMGDVLADGIRYMASNLKASPEPLTMAITSSKKTGNFQTTK